MDPWPLSEKVRVTPQNVIIPQSHFLSEGTAGSIGEDCANSRFRLPPPNETTIGQCWIHTYLSYISDIWLVVWNIFNFAIYWECHHPNWLIFFRGVETTNQKWYAFGGSLNVSQVGRFQHMAEIHRHLMCWGELVLRLAPSLQVCHLEVTSGGWLRWWIYMFFFLGGSVGKLEHIIRII